jgi:hypothetical protein
VRRRAGVVGPQVGRTLAQSPQGGLESAHQAQEGLRDAAGGPLPIGIWQEG